MEAAAQQEEHKQDSHHPVQTNSSSTGTHYNQVMNNFLQMFSYKRIAILPLQRSLRPQKLN